MLQLDFCDARSPIQAEPTPPLPLTRGISAVVQSIANFARPNDCFSPGGDVDSLHPKDWEYYREQAEMARRLGNICKSEQMWLAALHQTKRFDGKDPRVAYTLAGVAAIYMTSGKNDMAELYGRRALSLIEEIHGKNHVAYANCLNNLAGTCYNLKKYAESEPLSVTVLTTFNKLLGPSHANIGIAANNLAMVYHAQGKYDLAELMYERAIPLRKRDLGLTNPVIAALMENYANILELLGKADRCEAVRAEMRGSGIWHMFDSNFTNRLTA